MVRPIGEEARLELQRTAQQVREEIAAAGLPANGNTGGYFAHGASVEIDATDEEMAGVIVGWRPHPTLANAAMSRARVMDTESPVVKRFNDVSRTMLTALAGILQAAGFELADEDEQARDVIRVVGRPESTDTVSLLDRL